MQTANTSSIKTSENEKNAYIHTIQIKVPLTAKWEPTRVQQFINTLFTLTETTTLSIRANNRHITWWVEVGKQYVS